MFTVRKAKHVGRGHLLKFVNCQDAFTCFEGDTNGKQTVIGIICDGCSEGENSEVGARLASEFLVREALSLLEKGVPVNVIPSVLYNQMIEFLRSILASGFDWVGAKDRINFIKNQLLFTVVGFILNEEDCVVFSAGDGTIVINDEVHIISQDNKPTYPAYHLVERSALEVDATEIPKAFAILQPKVASLHRLAIGSDAWHEERNLLGNIWGYKNPAGLQRQINVWSKDRHFEDDVSLITVEVESRLLPLIDWGSLYLTDEDSV